MKRFLLAVLFVALAAAPVFADETNMVYNPGFQMALNGWSVWGSAWLAPEGQDSTNAAYSWIGSGGWQDITITDPLKTLKISGWLADMSETLYLDPLDTTAYVAFRLEFKDAGGTILNKWESDKLYGNGSGLGWTQLSGYATPGADVVKATLVWETQGSGHGTGRFDNFSVTAVPEPVSTALFLLGGATLAVKRLRRKKG